MIRKNPIIEVCRLLGKALKPVLTRTLYRPGTVATIFAGPSKGLKYHIYPGFGLSHLYGGWEPLVHEVISKVVKPGQVVYDVGANYGLYSILMSRLVGATGSVHAFEPMAGIFEQANRNRELNGLSNLHLVPMAVSSAAGTASFVVGHHEGAGHLSDAGRGDSSSVADQTVTVNVTTIDAYVAEGHASPDVIKIDVEGAESAVLQGASHTMDSARPLLLIELHTPEQDKLTGAALLKHGYKAFRMTPGFPAVKNMNEGYPSPDGMMDYVIAVHQDRLVGGRPF